MTSIPDTQCAVQLVGEDKLTLNTAKEVHQPGPHQILCKVKVVGLCFSDLKLLKQFDGHVRKKEVVSGIDLSVLDEIPSYVPSRKPTVPGHEPVVEIVAVGEAVTHFKPGEQYFVQADWRWLKTENSNGAFGYNFEGALQEYVLLDERIVISPEGESMLMPANDPERAISAYGLVEPWACVEESYVAKERTTLKEGGRLLAVACATIPEGALSKLFDACGKPAEITWVSGQTSPEDVDVPLKTAATIEELPETAFDDIVYFGARKHIVEQFFDKMAKGGLLNIVQCGETFDEPVSTALGRVHYAGLRITGSAGDDVLEGMRRIPATAEIRPDDRINVVGAGGPMGVMHVMRNLCQGVAGVTVLAGDLSDDRLAALDRIALPAAEQNQAGYRSYNAKTNPVTEPCNYISIMAPVPALVAQAVQDAADQGIINIFAGIQAGVNGDIDLDSYLKKGLYFIGTSGSVMEDMRIVLGKVQSGKLDTNVSVAAISGLNGAIDGIRKVEKQEVPGKILVYPQCKDLKVTLLEELSEQLPEVAAKLDNGVWTKEAEQALLAHYA